MVEIWRPLSFGKIYTDIGNYQPMPYHTERRFIILSICTDIYRHDH